MRAYALCMVFVYPLGAWFTMNVWLWSYRHHLDPTDLSVEEAIEARFKDEVLLNAPVAAIAVKFVPRWVQ